MTFSTLNQELIYVEENVREINENLCFNTKLLIKCRQYSEIDDIEPELKQFGGKLLEDKQLQLVDKRTVHPPGEPLYNKKTDNFDYPNGLQIRENMITDTKTVDIFAQIIANRRWSPKRDQIILILLPEEYRYVNDDGIEVIWGILDGNHRVDGANKQQEENIIAWKVSMPLDNIRKYGNAVCNRDDNVVNPRQNRDIVASIIDDIKNPDKKLHKDIEKCGDDQQKLDKILKDEIISYKVHHKRAESILRDLQWEDNSGLNIRNKPWDSPRMGTFIDKHPDCKEWNEAKQNTHNYETSTGAKVIVIQAEGSQVLSAAYKYAQLIAANPDEKIQILISLAKKIADKSEERIMKERKKIQREFWEILKTMGVAQNLKSKKEARLPYVEFFPENSVELNTKRFITIEN